MTSKGKKRISFDTAESTIGFTPHTVSIIEGGDLLPFAASGFVARLRPQMFVTRKARHQPLSSHILLFDLPVTTTPAIIISIASR